MPKENHFSSLGVASETLPRVYESPIFTIIDCRVIFTKNRAKSFADSADVFVQTLLMTLEPLHEVSNNLTFDKCRLGRGSAAFF